MDFQFDIFIESFPTLLKGAVLTVQLTVISVVLGLIIGLIGALGRVSRNRLLRGVTICYITLMRAVPLLLTLMFLYYGLPSAGIDLSAFTIAIIALSVTNGAYVTEIIRAGIESIDPGQMRGARSLGMSYSLAMRRIILPQAVRVILPPLGNEFNAMLKNTTLVSVIGVPELLMATQMVTSATFRVFELYTVVALYYLALTTAWGFVQSAIERRFGDPGQDRQAPTPSNALSRTLQTIRAQWSGRNEPRL